MLVFDVNGLLISSVETNKNGYEPSKAVPEG